MTLRAMQIDYEIIFVNDGSRDRTAEILSKIAAYDERVKIVHHLSNQGYGAALRSGFRAATKTLVFYTDADGQFDMNELPPLIQLINHYDIVSCFRLDRQDGLIRKINAWCWTRFTCCIFRMKVKDINCAFKLYKHRIFDEIEMHSTGAMINAEIFARAFRCGYTVTQVGVRHYPRGSGQQTGSKLFVVIRSFWELAKLYNNINFCSAKLSERKSSERDGKACSSPVVDEVQLTNPRPLD